MTVREFVGCLLLGCLLAVARVQGAPPPPAQKAPEKKKEDRSVLQSIGDHLTEVLRDGDSTIYASGYAYHKRSVYGADVRRYLNEDAWGGGFGRTLTLPDGGVAAIAFTAFEDSLGQTEYNLGYTREWRWAPFHGELKLGAGLTAFVTSRPDFFRGTPFPAVLPQLSLEHGDAAIIATLVPRIPDVPDGLGEPDMNGDIVYLYARVRLH